MLTIYGEARFSFRLETKLQAFCSRNRSADRIYYRQGIQRHAIFDFVLHSIGRYFQTTSYIILWSALQVVYG